MPENTQNDADTAFDFETQVPKVALGTPVVYIGTKGVEKMALVVNTPDTITEGTSLPGLAPGQLHLVVWTHNAGHFTPRYNVPFAGAMESNTEFTNDEGVTVGVWKLA